MPCHSVCLASLARELTGFLFRGSTTWEKSLATRGHLRIETGGANKMLGQSIEPDIRIHITETPPRTTSFDTVNQLINSSLAFCCTCTDCCDSEPINEIFVVSIANVNQM